jgi:hypothetical protein
MGKCDGIVDLNTFKIIEKMAIVVWDSHICDLLTAFF